MIWSPGKFMHPVRVRLDTANDGHYNTGRSVTKAQLVTMTPTMKPLLVVLLLKRGRVLIEVWDELRLYGVVEPCPFSLYLKPNLTNRRKTCN